MYEEYTITRTSYKSWEVEKDEGNTYFVRLDPDRVSNSLTPYTMRCSCIWFVTHGSECRHIKMVKEDIENKRRDKNK